MLPKDIAEALERTIGGGEKLMPNALESLGDNEIVAQIVTRYEHLFWRSPGSFSIEI